MPHTQRKIISDLSRRDDIILLKQDKGRGIVVMDRSKYTKKCLEMLSTKQFTVVENDPTKTLESRIQRTLRKLKSKITDQEYKTYIRQDHSQRNSMVLQKCTNSPLMGILIIYHYDQ